MATIKSPACIVPGNVRGKVVLLVLDRKSPPT
jgi:hypothetical protein